MSKHRIGITGIGSVSPLGSEGEEIWQQYFSPKTLIKKDANGDFYCKDFCKNGKPNPPIKSGD